MRNFVLRLVINGLAIAIVAALLPGINVVNNDIGTLLILAILIGIVNAIVRPIVMILSCPFILLSLGLLVPIINGLMLLLVASLAGDRMTIDDPSLLWAIIGGIIMGIIVMILESVLGVREDDERRERA